MSIAPAPSPRDLLKTPKGLSPRIQWLRDYYFQGDRRAWNNEFTAWTTGTPWDVQFNELTYYIVPETYTLMQALRGSYRQAARVVPLNRDFWTWSLPERRAWFVKEVMVRHLPREILPGDLLAGARFNLQTSLCLTKKEQAAFDRLILGPKGARAAVKAFHDHGYGNAGATCGHLIPGYERVLTQGFKGIHDDLKRRFDALDRHQRQGGEGAQLAAMMTAATMPRDLAEAYRVVLETMVESEKNADRKLELAQMAHNLSQAPWLPARNFWEAVQALWMAHMLVMADENYPGPGVSFGRIDQYLLPYWRKSMAEGMDREFGKEILKCFWFHCNTAYDAQIRTGNQGITAGFGQLITLSGMGGGGKDLTNELTYVFLEVIDEMSPILEPKPNVRLHRNTPEKLYDTVIDMIGQSQGAPFLLNFDERSMAGMLREAKEAGLEELIHKGNVHDYAPVGCLENTMVGNDRSGTVDNNVNLVKAVELALTGGREDLTAYRDMTMGTLLPLKADGPDTGDPRNFKDFEEFYQAYTAQTAHIIRKTVALYERSEAARAAFFPTPYLSCLVDGCAEKARDVTRGGATISLVTIEAVTYATTVDSLLAVKYLVFDRKLCTMDELITALKDNWQGHEVLKAHAKNRAPKYGRDDDEADQLGRRVMDLWTGLCWTHRTRSTGRRFRPGMLSWNYWAGDGYVVAATPDGRARDTFLSNAICPSNGADTKGPTANANSVGAVLGGRREEGADFLGYFNSLPNGASHTITFNPSILADPEHQEKFKAFLKGYVENGGTALQINMLDPDMLKDAQEHPQDYRHLLVRVTGYNAYFTSIGRELQNEVIARVSHRDF